MLRVKGYAQNQDAMSSATKISASGTVGAIHMIAAKY